MFKKLVQKGNAYKKIRALVLLCFLAVITSVMSISVFAAASVTYPDVAITTEMVTPYFGFIKDNAMAIGLFGLGVFVVIFGVSLIPAIIRRFIP